MKVSIVDEKHAPCKKDRLLEQAFLTLNLLRASKVNPKLSAYAYLFGNFDFNSHHWHLQVPKQSFILSQPNGHHGTQMEKLAGILALVSLTIVV